MAAYPNANHNAQDVRKANAGSFAELLKYVTKMLGKDKRDGQTKLYPAQILDNIYVAMFGRRTFQNFGFKGNPEDKKGNKAEAEAETNPSERLWRWKTTDWVDEHETGECLTGYEPSEALLQIFRNTDRADRADNKKIE